VKPNTDTPELDYVELLQLHNFSEAEQELGAREYRIRGVDSIINELKKELDKEEANALNRYLRMCPPIVDLTDYLKSHYPESKPLFAAYIPKLHKKIPTLK